ncbi:MAG: hypothetical protein WCY11_15750 [Novosphingobium sp.]
MTDLPESERARMRIRKSRNRVFAVLLVGFVVLVYAISIVKMS